MCETCGPSGNTKLKLSPEAELILAGVYKEGEAREKNTGSMHRSSSAIDPEREARRVAWEAIDWEAGSIWGAVKAKLGLS